MARGKIDTTLEDRLEHEWVDYLRSKYEPIFTSDELDASIKERIANGTIASPVQFMLGFHGGIANCRIELDAGWYVFLDGGSEIVSVRDLADYESKKGRIDRRAFRRWCERQERAHMPKVRRHHCAKCGAFLPESEMRSKSYHPAGMRKWFVSYTWYCKDCSQH